MLRWAAKVAAHAVATSGRGASAAGLMASAVKDPGTGSWGLEAGAFVLADGGLCCLVCTLHAVAHGHPPAQTRSRPSAGLLFSSIV